MQNLIPAVVSRFSQLNVGVSFAYLCLCVSRCRTLKIILNFFFFLLLAFPSSVYVILTYPKPFKKWVCYKTFFYVGRTFWYFEALSKSFEYLLVTILWFLDRYSSILWNTRWFFKECPANFLFLWMKWFLVSDGRDKIEEKHFFGQYWISISNLNLDVCFFG